MEVEKKEIPDYCERCRRPSRKTCTVPNGHRLGPNCLRVLIERTALRRSGQGPLEVNICTDTKKEYLQDVRYKGVCPGVSCWACDYMLKEVCPAEELDGIKRGGVKSRKNRDE